MSKGDETQEEDTEVEIDKEDMARNAQRARLLSSGDAYYLFLGAVGACK